MGRYLHIVRVLGLIILIFGLTMLAPIGLSWYLKDGALPAYDEAFFITTASGFFLWYFTRYEKRDLNVRDGFLMAVLTWTVLPFFACLPFMYYEGMNASFTDAYFEAMSGLTTTGSTVFSNLDTLPPSINLWRCEMVWLGGMGLIVLVVAVLPMLGIGGRQMFKAETPGPMKDSNLTPRITETAKGLWVVYGLITLACITSYWLAGMTPFDAVVHAFSTMGLGGFSSHDASFGYWNSPTIELVSIFFMLLAGINFATHFMALRGGSLSVYRHDVEAIAYLAITLFSIFLVAVYLLYYETYEHFTEALRFSAFNVVSIATTTGYASTDYNLWPIFAPIWMLFLSSFATSAGSTGGGIKMMRALVLYHQVFRELVRAMHPAAVKPVRIGGMALAQPILFAVLSFAFAYMCLIVALTLILTFTGLGVVTSFSAVVASINNTGPGLNEIGPATTYAVLNDFQTWICTFAMLIGRLEIFTLLVVLTPAFWKK